MLAAAQGQLGEARAAGDALERLRELSPMTLPEIAALLYRKEEHRALFLEGIALAEALQGEPAAK
jgi:hypothetical protein